MYCRNCGKEMGDYDKFCKECGTNSTGTTQPTFSQVSDKVKSFELKSPYFLCSLITSVVIAFFLLKKWVYIKALAYFDSNIGATLFGIFKQVRKLSKLTDESFALTSLISFVFIVMGIIALGLLAYFCYKLFTDLENSVSTGSEAMILVSVLSVLFIITIFFANIVIESKTDGWITKAFEMTSAPWITLFGGLIGNFVFVKKLGEEIWHSNHPIEKSILSSPKKTCPKCKYVYDEGMGNCPDCGFREKNL